MVADGAKKKTAASPGYTADQVAASLAANPQAAWSGGVIMPPQYVGDTAGTAPGGTPSVPAPANPFDTNPGYLAAVAAEQAGSQQADAALRAAQEAAIVGYGDPSIAASLGFSVDDNTSAAARANYLSGNSTLSRLDKQHGLNQQASINSLAAHGILNSGETGYQRGQIDQGYGNQVYDAGQQLSGALNSATAADVAAKSGLHNNTNSALQTAYGQQIADPSAYGAAQGQIPLSQIVNQSVTNQGAPGSNPVAAALAKPKSKLAVKPLAPPYPKTALHNATTARLGY